MNNLFPELSDRQFLILKMVANGYSNYYISLYTQINQRTVEYHIRRIIKLADWREAHELRAINIRARLAHMFYKRLLDAVGDIARV